MFGFNFPSLPSPLPVSAHRISVLFSFSFHQPNAIHPNLPAIAFDPNPVHTAADLSPVADDADLWPVADDAELSPVADDADL